MTTDPRARRRALRDALDARRQAQRLLDDLLVARRDTLERLRETGRSDALAAITGRTAFDDAIDQTRRLLERLCASLERTRKALAVETRASDSRAFDERAFVSDAGPHGSAAIEPERLALAVGAD